MGASKKKKRGQQRKAAKKDRVPIGITLFIPLPDDDDSVIVHPENKKYILQLVRNGIGPVTERLVNYNIDATNYSLVDSGVLSVVLDFLKRCEDENFIKVVTCLNGNAPENLKTPSTWIDLLQKASLREPSCSLQIAQNIRPLVNCMCNDTERLFFRSNKHWREGILPFIRMICSMIHNCWVDELDRKIKYTLFQNEGLLSSIIQWQYWGEHRPDITKELEHDCENIARVARDAITTLITDPDNFLRDDDAEWTEDGKAWLLMAGTTPIVNRDYDPSCNVSYVVELIRRIKIEGWNEEDEDILDDLITETDCVDKDVIIGVIGLGLNYHYREDEFEYAAVVAHLSNNMINIWVANRKSEANDTRVAFAIRAGLVEMCFTFIGHHVQVEDSFSYIESIFECIHEVSLHQKSAKAIRSKKSSIEEKLHQLDENVDITNNPKCKKLLDMIRSIINLNGSYCCRCNKSLSKTNVKVCNGCHRMTYCSRSCQKEDWLNGHSVSCNKGLSAEQVGQFQGRYEPELPEDKRAAAKLKELEININMIQNKLFLDNAENILRQAKALDLPLYDCVVKFDLREYPLTVVVEDYKENFLTPKAVKGFEQSRSKENITCDYFSSILKVNWMKMMKHQSFKCKSSTLTSG